MEGNFKIQVKCQDFIEKEMQGWQKTLVFSHLIRRYCIMEWIYCSLTSFTVMFRPKKPDVA